LVIGNDFISIQCARQLTCQILAGHSSEGSV
jgi:hypothetical protein